MKRRSLVALLFAAGDMRRYVFQIDKERFQRKPE